MNVEHQSIDKTLSFPWIEREIEKFRAYLHGEKRTSRTIETYLNALTKFLIWFGKPTKELTTKDMQRYKESLAEKYCENTMAYRIHAINNFVTNILDKAELRMKAPQQVFKPKMALTKEDIRKMLDETRQPLITKRGRAINADTSLRDRAMLCLLYPGGLRASEIAAQKISDLDLDNKRLNVSEGKGKNHEPVCLNNESAEAIREYIEKGRPEPSNPKYDDYLLLTMQGSPVNRKIIFNQTKKIAFRAGINKNVSPHTFRHTMITHMAEAGYSSLYIREQSRHKKLEMVLRYTHLSKKSVREAFDSVFESETEKENDENQNIQRISNHPELSNEQKGTMGFEDRRLKILNLYLKGIIEDDMLEKLLSTKGEFSTEARSRKCFDFV